MGTTLWQQLCEDKRIEDLPYKIETNGQGQIIMSPTHYFHGKHANRIARLLEKYLPDGEVVVECAVETSDGVKEADVAWLSGPLAERMQAVYACSPAPEICVEVLSPSNSWEEMMGKRQLFLAAGAVEYWLCDALGHLSFFDALEELPVSRLCPAFPRDLPKRR